MKRMFLNLFILFLLLNWSEGNSVSRLKEMVRMDIIDKSLLYLPKNNEVNILQMVNQMIKAKEEYSFNEAESAYLLFRWISENIEISFNEETTDDPISAYNLGKGTSKAISSLFNNICNFLKVVSGSISGYLKWPSFWDDKLKSYGDYTWNYIEINGEYYLLDVTLTSRIKFNPGIDYIYIYFGTDPEIFIRSHFPKDNKWQLLPEPYTLEKFESMALLTPFFYLLGFKTISPDTNNLIGSGKIILTSDILIAKEDISDMCSTVVGGIANAYYGSEKSLKNEVEYDIDEEKCLIYSINSAITFPNNYKPFVTIAYFNTNYTENSSLNLERM